MKANKEQIVALLYAFINQRAGRDARNYISHYADTEGRRAWFSEGREIAKDGNTARKLLRDIELRDSITADMMREGFRAYSGRLQLIEEDGKGARLEYCTGQYFATEYRRAVCAVCSAVLWAWMRDHCMPSKIVEGANEYYPHAKGGRNKQSAGDWLRTKFAHEYGRTIARRWFD